MLVRWSLGSASGQQRRPSVRGREADGRVHALRGRDRAGVAVRQPFPDRANASQRSCESTGTHAVEGGSFTACAAPMSNEVVVGERWMDGILCVQD